MKRTGQVLIAEDERYWREQVFGEALEEAGFAVVTAATCDQALKALDDHHFDVAVVDINLTGVSENTDGVRVIKKALRLNPHIGIVVVSGSKTRTQRVVQGLKLAAFIEKRSFDVSEFVRIVSDALPACQGA